MSSLSAIYILCHNDANTIQSIIDEIEFSSLTGYLDIIFVDDCSSDNTVKIIKNSPFKLIENKTNLGYGGSIKMITSDAFSRGIEYFGIFPGDHQRQLKDLLSMIRIANSQKFDTVVGVKYFYEKGNAGSLRRKFGNIFITRLCKLLFNKEIKDPLAGFKVYKTKNAFKVVFNCSSRFGFDIDYLFWSEFNQFKKYYYNANVSYLNNKSSIKNVQIQGSKFIIRIIIYYIIQQLFKLINLQKR